MRKLFKTCSLFLISAVGMQLACSDSETGTDLNPEGPPEIIQLYALERNPVSGVPQFTLGFGAHPDWDAAIGIGAAITDGEQRIRVVVDELLNGSTVEQFLCACADPDGTPNCVGSPEYTLAPEGCVDNPDTLANETGRWYDPDIDGVPDVVGMIPGVASISCGGGFTWTADIDGGWYNPSGNQFPGSDGQNFLWDYIGPAIVLTPGALPTNSPCSVAIANSVTDKDGNPVQLATGQAGVDDMGNPIMYPVDLGFTTEPLVITDSDPDDGATGLAVAIPLITITMNAPLDPATVNATNVTVTNGGDVTTAAQVSATDPSTIEVTATLAAATTYTVTITTAVTDSFGNAAPAPITFTFTTM